MLQRAASNAYSWWWASHIRTSQSKWLDTTLHEMEDRVKAMIKLIGADADSFGKKAELYFKSRPELINHVEEMFRSYQALADRYDRISGELHKANHTIATVFPDQVQFSMQEGDGDGFLKALTGMDFSNFKPPMISRDMSSGTSPVPKRLQMHKKITSQMSKEKAQEEIDALQKKILVLQTEKEFLKSSSDTALGKYLDIERQVMELQDEVCSLQDAFNTSATIEDNEARALMAARALISCEDTLVSLQDQQKRSCEEAKTEFQRINKAKDKLKTFKSDCGQPDTQQDDHDHQDIDLSSTLPSAEDDDSVLNGGRLDLQAICEKVKEQIELRSESLVVELADKVDRLVDKVLNLELSTSSQNAQINRMRTETDELQERVQSLEDDKAALAADSSKLAKRLKQVELLLQTILRIVKNIQDEQGNIHKQLTEACSDLTDFVERLHAPDPQTSEVIAESSQESKGIASEEDDVKGTTPMPGMSSELLHGDSGLTSKSVNKESSISLDYSRDETEKHGEESMGPVVWQQLVLNGLEGEGKVLLEECSSILHNCEDTKVKLSEFEKKNQEYHLEALSEVKELRSDNAMKDEEIRSLRRMLSSLQTKFSASMCQNVEKSEESSKIHITHTPEDKEIAEIEEYIKQCQVEELPASSVVEEKFRVQIDRVLEENLDFWLRFSTSYHQLQNFQSSFDKLKADMDNLTDAQAQGGMHTISSSHQVTDQEPAGVEKKFRGMNTDLQVWLEKNVLLKGELESRFSSLCGIQEDITKMTTLDQTDEVCFTPFLAAKFQGEVLNMKQENSKVAKELEAGLDHVKGLQIEVGRVLLKLRESSELSIARSNRAQQNFRNLSTKAGVPLRTFLFGTKPKKPSLFSCMSPSVHKHYTNAKAGRR